MGYDILVYLMRLSRGRPIISRIQEMITLGVDQFSFGTTDPLRRAISRDRRTVKSAKGSGS